MATIPVNNNVQSAPVISGSVRPQAPALFVITGTLSRFRAAQMVDRETGAVRWVHNITLFQQHARRYINCSYWSDQAVDLRPMLNKEMEFYCTSVRASQNAQYGTNIGKGIPPVDFQGSISPDLAAEYSLVV